MEVVLYTPYGSPMLGTLAEVKYFRNQFGRSIHEEWVHFPGEAAIFQETFELPILHKDHSIGLRPVELESQEHKRVT